jgi:hypothetical protein
VFADQQGTAAEADDALNWAAVGGRHSMVGAYAQFATKPINHRLRTRAYDSVDPPVGSVGGDFVYGAGRAPYASEGGSSPDFQLQGR